MDPSAASPSFEVALAEQESFLRRLARALISDEHAAEDAVQETLLSAWRIENDPQRERSEGAALGSLPPARLRAWLATALKRKSFSKYRTEVRRGEEVAADFDDVTSAATTPDEIALRLERQLLLQQVTMDLAPRYRTALVLRYQDGLSAAQLAERLDIPLSTARSRIHRGLAQVREELDRISGESGAQDARAHWLPAMTALAYPARMVPHAASSAAGPDSLVAPGMTRSAARAAPTAVTGASIPFLSLKKGLALVALLLVAGATYGLVEGPAPTESRIVQPTQLLSASAADVERMSALSGESERRPGGRIDGKDANAQPRASAARSDSTPAPAVIPGAAPRLPRIEGRALLMDGTAIAGVLVVAELDRDGETLRLGDDVTDGEGAFSIPLDDVDPAARIQVTASEETHLPEGAVVEGVAPDAAGLELRLDALEVQLLPPAGEPGAGVSASTGAGFLRVVPDGPGIGADTAWFYPYRSSQEGDTPRLLPTGPGYIFQVLGGEFGERELTATLPAGLLSGSYTVELSEANDETASYEVTLTGEALPAGSSQSIYVSLRRTHDVKGVPLKVKQNHGALSVGGAETVRLKSGCLPGRSSVSVRMASQRPDQWVYPEAGIETIELLAGDTVPLPIELKRGGRMALTMNVPDVRRGTPVKDLSAVIRPVREGRAGRTASAWKHVLFLAPGGTGAADLTPWPLAGEALVLDGILAPGSYEVATLGDGYAEVTGSFEVLPGELTEVELDVRRL